LHVGSGEGSQDVGFNHPNQEEHMAEKKTSAAGKPKDQAKAATGGKGGAKPAGGGGFMQALQPDDALAAVVGSTPLPRTEVTKRIWDYIKQNNLQDPKDKRTIKADAKLKKVFDGKDSVSMFEMTKLVNAHLKK
jgi:upstream activation factor subunit UAF30